jgi:hypothetical protein
VRQPVEDVGQVRKLVVRQVKDGQVCRRHGVALPTREEQYGAWPGGSDRIVYILSVLRATLATMLDLLSSSLIAGPLWMRRAGTALPWQR